MNNSSDEEQVNALRPVWQGLLDTVLNLQLDINIDGQLLKAFRDKVVAVTPNYQTLA